MLRLVLIAFLCVVSATPALVRAEEEKEEFENQYTMRPEVYERLDKAQTALKENRFDAAIAELERIMSRLRPNPYEKALTLQTYGYVYANQEKLGLAAEKLGECHALNALPPSTQQSILFNIGQLHLAAENYTLAVAAFDAWIAETKEPNTDALYMIAAANYQAKRYQRATYYGERAMKSTSKPKDALLQLLLSAYVEQKRYAPATTVLTQLIERHPGQKNNWLQLAAMYAQLGEEKKALAVMQLAHEAKLLSKSDEIIQLTQRLMAEDIPHAAGLLLEEAMKQNTVEVNAKTARMLATAWYQARDTKKAAPAMERAARLAKDGELYFRLAQIHVSEEQWSQAVSACEMALKTGGLKNEGQIHLVMGIALVRQGNSARAKRAFTKASQFSAVKAPAKGWLQFLSSAAASAAAAQN